MFYDKLFLFLCISHMSLCDWADSWMAPIQAQFPEEAKRDVIPSRIDSRSFLDEILVMPNGFKEPTTPAARSRFSTVSLKVKLEETLANAGDLLEKLQMQISRISLKEKILKEAIVSGRSGVTAVTVSTIDNTPRSYIVRDGIWSVCNGMVQYPSMVQPQPTSLFQELFSTPRCIGQEVMTKPDPCVFNSMIKYETLPTRRSLEYNEDDFFCLKSAFNNTLEQYLSVPRGIINDTCKDGIVRSYQDNVKQCGQRVLSDYTYYPQRSAAAAALPLEYCSEKDGSCKMIVAWHISNSSVENFEFLKNENDFKKYFIKSSQSYPTMHLM